MRLFESTATWRAVLISLVVMPCPGFAHAQAATRAEDNSQIKSQPAAETLKTIDRLVEQNRELMEEIEALRRNLGAQAAVPPATPPTAPAEGEADSTARRNEAELEAATPPVMDGSQEGEAPDVAEVVAAQQQGEHKKFGAYTPNFGFTVADTDYGTMNISAFSYIRYLNQLNLAPTYTNAFGATSPVQRRQDFQFAKVQIKVLGWVGTPKLRYFLYTWTSNANQGQGAQVVVAGNLNYSFTKYFILSGGNQWPAWNSEH